MDNSVSKLAGSYLIKFTKAKISILQKISYCNSYFDIVRFVSLPTHQVKQTEMDSKSALEGSFT